MKNREVIIAELSDLHASFGEPEFNVATLQAPESYFRHFPDEMTAIIKAMNSGVTLSVSYKTERAYAIPEDYFSRLPELLLASVKTADQTIHKGIYNWDNAAKINPYHLPDNYFAQFETELFDRVFQPALSAETEIEQLSPLLAGLKQQQVFDVPADYFKTEIAVKAPVPKVIEHPSVKSIKWARWAAAAAILFIFSLGAFHMFSPETADSKPSFQQALAQIPRDSIKEWLSTNMDEDDINSLGSSIVGMGTVNANTKLKGFTDKEIEQYIEAEVW